MPTRPLRVWVAGDSLAQVPGQAIQRRSGSGRLLEVGSVESRLSTGLTRPDLYNWFTRFGEVITRSARPSSCSPSAPTTPTTSWRAFPRVERVGPLGSPSWRAEYRRRVDGVTREFNAAGIVTIWIGLPIPDGPGFARSFPIVNSILDSVAKAHPKQARYVDTWHALDSPHGKYTPYLRVDGKLTLLRPPDGVHYTAAGGDVVADEIVRDLGRFYTLPG